MLTKALTDAVARREEPFGEARTLRDNHVLVRIIWPSTVRVHKTQRDAFDGRFVVWPG